MRKVVHKFKINPFGRNPYTDWTLCGASTLQVRNTWKGVTCKRCLKLKGVRG